MTIQTNSLATGVFGNSSISSYLLTSGTKWTGGLYTGLVANRGKAPTSNSAVNKQMMARSIHVATQNITRLGVAFANWYVDPSTGEKPAGGDATITAAIEYPLGTTSTPLLFSGSASGTAKDYATLYSDLLTKFIPTGSQFAVRFYYTSAIGIVFNDYTARPGAYAFGECFQFAASGISDLTASVGTFSNTDGALKPICNPVAIFGPTTAPSISLLGDSRVEGYLDDPSTSLCCGEFERAITASRGFMNLSKSGETALTASSQYFRNRVALTRKYATHVFSNYGVNDLFLSGNAPDLILQKLEQLRLLFPSQWFYQTIPPGETTSTDAWATVGNQTTANVGDEANRVLLANYLRSGNTFFDGVFDSAAPVESSQNSGKFKAPGYTTDGIHLTALGYAATAAFPYVVVP